ncbi:hypothetical protein K491DRAFT_684457 [Lophiostoma macrostomum CBS 122681]|uniref:BZIP domain-containing protein n=1 Tax=Lophiostoma macrostomum CBS 122681 TaxID=1314788 RepID=A0A6A6SLZ9_9PLEO|nr:hypothetical protein K491DRAFT_684457 [Lophiostoma macrostomum CBS 122681]
MDRDGGYGRLSGEKEGGGGTNTKRPYKRKLTEKRRLQNRAAQKNYRARRKERLDFLEKTVASTVPSNQQKESDITRNSAHPPATTSESPETNGIATDPEIRSRVPPGPLAFDYVFNALPSPTTTSSQEETVRTTQNETPQSRPAPTDPTRAALKKIFETDDNNDVENLLSFLVTNSPDLKSIVLEGLRALKAKQPITPASPDPTDPSTSPKQTSMIPSFSSLKPSATRSLEIPAILPVLPLPMMNGIFLRPQSAMSVYDANARAIGLTLELVSKRDCQSPFYTAAHPILPQPPEGHPSSSPLINLHDLPPDLIPTPSQHMYWHHPFFDLIPIPWFRERVISLAALDPLAFDKFELKADILIGGMRCWQSRGHASGQPWDRRCWEVEPWFLKKWGWLIEEGGRLEGQSRWWRGLRGEG